MKQITFIRHAEVDIDNSKKMGSSSLQKWVKKYDTSPICENSLPSSQTIKLAKSADILITSSLSRAIDSAKVLGAEAEECSELFDEAAIPKINIPFLKLKPKTWLVILRVLLLVGFGKKDTSLKASKEQAGRAMQRLLELSIKNDHIVLVGHGGMNWLIRKVLIKRGWKLEGKSSHENWGASILKKI